MNNLKSLALKFNYDLKQKKTELLLLDQTLLPQQEIWNQIINFEEMVKAIQLLQVRGAPLIGVSAALCLIQEALKDFNPDQLLQKSHALRAARPTAVNLMNALDVMNAALLKNDLSLFFETGVKIFNDDVLLCEKIAMNGQSVFNDGDSILTHCNTGGLATAGIGTALGVIQKVHQSGKKIHVYVDETRPLLQGGRLTTWELEKLNIPFTLITDNMAASLMASGKINKAIVGADRIAVNGDFANKIGTYSVAVQCHFHQVPFYTAAPMTTVDPNCATGASIKIEERDFDEVRGFVSSKQKFIWALEKSNAYNPSFDVTPENLVTGWITDRGLYTKLDIAQNCFGRNI
jgi:methylthioribose-1-phosphate isomerase